MTVALTPTLAVSYLTELSTDIRAVVVLDARAAGGYLAGAEALVAPALELLDAAGPSTHGVLDRGRTGPRSGAGATHVFGACDDRHGLVVVTGPYVLIELLQHDLGAVLKALGGGIDAAPPKTAPRPLVEAVVEASIRME